MTTKSPGASQVEARSARYPYILYVRIKLLRDLAGLTQEEVAEAMGVTHTQVGRWEKGAQQIPSGRVLALAALFRCHPGEIFAELPVDARLAQIARRLPERELRLWIEIGEALARLKK